MGFFSFHKPQQIKQQQAIFCIPNKTEEILSIIETTFELDSHKDSTNVRQLVEENLGITITFTAWGVEEQEKLSDTLKNAWSFFRQVKTEHIEVQRNVLHHLKRCQGLVKVDYCYEAKNKKELQEKEQIVFIQLSHLADALCGLVTKDDRNNEYYSFYRGDHCLLDSNGESDFTSYWFDEPERSEWMKGMKIEALERREHSLEQLKRQNIYTPLWLSVIDTEFEVTMPSVREICGRAGALLVVALYSECLLAEGMSIKEASDFIANIRKDFQVDQYLSLREFDYLNNSAPTKTEQIHFSWQYENLLMMEWALGFVEELPEADRICDVPFVVRIMNQFSSLADMIEKSQLRDTKELLDYADFIFRLDWACTDARLDQLPAPNHMDPEVVMERHKSIFWITGCSHESDWDLVDVST